MNAVTYLARALPRHILMAMLPASSRGDSDPHGGCNAGGEAARNQRHASTESLCARICDRYALDLAGFLNRCRREALNAMAAHARVPARGPIGTLRARLWHAGACLEAGGAVLLGSPLQPVPVVLGGRLVFPGPPRGMWPPAAVLPRPMPAPALQPVPEDEPECLEDLLANASALIGVRLGAPRPERGKGAFGTRVAALLGVVEHGVSEPDWRGEVEIKTVPVVRDRVGIWRVKEDPAVGMVGSSPLAKLARVLWVARVADAPDSTVLSWYYQERDAELSALMNEHLHTRPKGAAGTRGRGWYLHKHFFLASGFFRVLNG